MLDLDLDKNKMIEDLKNYPEQIKQTLGDLENIKFKVKKIKNIVFCGMGGSAIGGDLIASAFEDELEIPMIIKRDYELPNFVDKKTLVIVCSFSGNTEETLSCFKLAQERGAQILAISSNGKLEKESSEKNIPFFKINYTSQCGQPRVNSGVMLTAVAGILDKVGLISLDKDIWEIIQTSVINLQKDCLYKSEKDNVALEIASKIQGKIPVFHGAGFLATVARRMKQDINETGKQFAFYEPVPESNHNATVGYQFPQDKSKLIMISLESSLDHQRNKLRWEILQDMWQKHDLESLTLLSESGTKLEQLFYFVYLGMWISFYVGILNGIDPTPVEVIKFLKDELARA